MPNINITDVVYYFGWPCLVHDIDENDVTLINYQGTKEHFPIDRIKELEDKTLYVEDI